MVTRRFVFRDRVSVEDRFVNAGGLVIRWLRGGRPFVGIHMASAGYYDGSALASRPASAVEIDAAALSRTKSIGRTEQV